MTSPLKSEYAALERAGLVRMCGGSPELTSKGWDVVADHEIVRSIDHELYGDARPSSRAQRAIHSETGMPGARFGVPGMWGRLFRCRPTGEL